MHKYLRAIGFSKFHNRKQIQELLKDCISFADFKKYVSLNDEVIFSEFQKEFANGIGIAVRGEFDDESRFIYEYYFPYIKSTHVSSYENISIERHAEKESYAGVCDEMKVGVSLIFYLQNVISYLKLRNEEKFPIKGTSLNLSALSVSGIIMMPIEKNAEQKKKIHKRKSDRLRLLQEARSGDPQAMETLTLDDMDIYTNISKKIRQSDLFTIVDSCFMPYGVECDMYNILGEIVECEQITNQLTQEKLWVMTINCNDLLIDVCINTIDLYGEPEVGRRFKGCIWLQGFVNYPEVNE